MSFKVCGTLEVILDTVQVTDSFKKREFVIEVPGTYPDLVKFQLTQAKTDMIENYMIGQVITVHFNLRGKKSVKNGVESYFNNLDAWQLEAGDTTTAKIATAPASKPAPAPTAKEAVKANQASKDEFSGQISDDDDGLPF